MKKVLVGFAVCVVLVIVVAGYAVVRATSASSPGPTKEPEPDDEPVVIIEGTPVIWFFDSDAVAKLRDDMASGKTPRVCKVLYDAMGSRPAVEVTDPDIITELFGRLSQMIVPEGGRALPITDSYHYIFFTLEDGSQVGWRFDGAACIEFDGEYYPVKDLGNLWGYVQELQDQQMNS